MMSSTEIGVYVFYSLLTWFAAPALAQKMNRSNEEGFVAGFLTSMLLYHFIGKKMIYKKSADE